MVDQAALAEVLDDFTTTVSGDFAVDDILRRLAQAAVRVLPVDGAGVMVPRGGELLRFVSATGVMRDPVEGLERLQELLQDGPCRDSLAEQRIVNIADLAVEGAWPSYMAQAEEVSLRAVCAIPLLARGRGWGVLDIYRSAPRRLDVGELAAAQKLANLATSYLVVTADRDTARDAQEQLAHRAMHDPLTGLPVRWVFLEQLAHALARLARSPGQYVGVLFLDLDGLKYVNDTYGHGAGDELLRTCVERVRGALRPTDVIARLGGDEFVVLLEDLGGAPDGAGVARRILQELAAPYRRGGHAIQPSASLGLALTADPGHTPDALIAHADVAMYQAKQAGRGRYEVFDAALYAADRRRVAAQDRLVAGLRAAGGKHQLELHYQPIIDLTDRRGSGVHAVEALLRWRHPERGLLAAGAFMPVAERSGLMVELGAWVLGAACRQLAAWDEELGDRAPQRMFVNISVAELLQPGLANLVDAHLRQSGLPPQRLTLEITETGLVSDARAVTAAVAGLRGLGCDLAIDDFGTGYSSLSRLVQVPAGTLKVDRSFTRDVLISTEAAAVVAAVLSLGRTLERTVVVEGIEDAATLEVLRELGCTHAQGYHLAVPQPPQQLSGLLAGVPAS